MLTLCLKYTWALYPPSPLLPSHRETSQLSESTRGSKGGRLPPEGGEVELYFLSIQMGQDVWPSPGMSRTFLLLGLYLHDSNQNKNKACSTPRRRGDARGALSVLLHQKLAVTFTFSPPNPPVTSWCLGAQGRRVRASAYLPPCRAVRCTQPKRGQLLSVPQLFSLHDFSCPSPNADRECFRRVTAVCFIKRMDDAGRPGGSVGQASGS